MHSGDDASTWRLYSGASLTRLSQAPSLSQAPLSGASLRGTSLRLSTSAFHDPAEVEDQVPQLLKLCLIPRWWRVKLMFPCPQVRHPVVHLFLGDSRELPARDTWGGLRPGIFRPGLPREIDVRGGVLVLPYSSVSKSASPRCSMPSLRS